MLYGMKWISLPLLSLLSACTTTFEIDPATPYCTTYELIRPSRSDSEGTLRQVLRENEKWRRICQETPK